LSDWHDNSGISIHFRISLHFFKRSENFKEVEVNGRREKVAEKCGYGRI
jgi:hypothetical protein